MKGKCLSANGKEVKKGDVACPRDMELGTKIFIDGIGELICNDRYSKKLSRRFDVFFPDDKEAKKFGAVKRNVILFY